MTIYDALRELGVRLSAGSRWLTYDGKMFAVYERQYGSKQTRILIETAMESDAVSAFLRDGDEDAKEADALTSVIQSTDGAHTIAPRCATDRHHALFVAHAGPEVG